MPCLPERPNRDCERGHVTRLADSDREKWNYDLHTRIKHDILTQYLNPWTTILEQGSSSLAYIDAFAGRGRYSDNTVGSPLLSISAMVDSMNTRDIRASRAEFYFVENNRANHDNLQRELEAFAPAKDLRIRYQLFCAPFSAVHAQIIAEVRR